MSTIFLMRLSEINLELLSVQTLPAGSIRSLNILRILLGEGYHVSFLPLAGGREPKYTAQARAIGVQVITPIKDPQSWRLTYVGACAYDVIFVARRGVYQVSGGRAPALVPA
jgi:hypothetical protein